jgi:hypothetical protein
MVLRINSGPSNPLRSFFSRGDQFTSSNAFAIRKEAMKRGEIQLRRLDYDHIEQCEMLRDSMPADLLVIKGAAKG